MNHRPADDVLRVASRTAMAALASLVVMSGGCSPELAWSGSIALTPDSDTTSALVEAADARWEIAGVHPDAIRIVPLDGVPVAWLPSGARMADACRLSEGSNVCGCVALGGGAPKGVWLHRMCGSKNVVTHELGHLIAGRRGHLGAEDGCSRLDDPVVRAPHLMCERVGKVITAADLELVCDAETCVAFVPEAEPD